MLKSQNSVKMYPLGNFLMQGRCSKESAHGIQIEASARQPSHNPSPYVPLIRPVHARITARALAGARDNQGRSLPPRDDRVGISLCWTSEKSPQALG